MKIDASSIKLNASGSTAGSTLVKTETLSSFTELYQKKRLGFLGANLMEVQKMQPRNSVSKLAVNTSRQWYQATTLVNQPAVILSQSFFDEMNWVHDLIQSILDAMTSLPVFTPGKNLSPVTGKILGINFYPQYRNSFKTDSFNQAQKTVVTHYENQTLDFSAEGSVKTGDGAQIDFNLDLEMERSHFSRSALSNANQGQLTLIDPLIINFNGGVPKLSDVAFSFDLDRDGDTESLASLMPGSGFLSLDRNQDGKINDGSELFGPSTGNGFGELKAFDLDGNNWIDESDAVFDALSVWEDDGTGDLKITRIKDAGIGAIYLASIDTGFDFKNDDNKLLGSVKKTGVVLNENGTAGIVQEIDLSTLA